MRLKRFWPALFIVAVLCLAGWTFQAKPPRESWEYKMLIIRLDAKTEKQINDLGVDGWEMFAYETHVSNGTGVDAGEVPEGIFNAAATATKHIAASPEKAGGSAFQDSMALGLKIAEAAIVWPRLVRGANAESDEDIDPDTLSLADIATIMEWALGGGEDDDAQDYGAARRVTGNSAFSEKI